MTSDKGFEETTPEDGTEIDYHAHVVVGHGAVINASGAVPFVPQVLVGLGYDEDGNLVSSVVLDDRHNWSHKEFINALLRVAQDNAIDLMEGSE